jgi:hypothetical protein
LVIILPILSMVYPFLGIYLCIYKYFAKECLSDEVVTQD